MRIYHTSGARHMRPSVWPKPRFEFNGVIWITLPVHRYGGQPIRFMVGYDGWTLSLLGNVGDLETMVPAKSLVFVFCKAALSATQ
jgi:hypothetical protein